MLRTGCYLVGDGLVGIAFTGSPAMTPALQMVYGLLGFVAQFGLLTLPIFKSRNAIKKLQDPSDRLLLSALALLVSITIVEQLPNDSISPWSWLLAGALLGRIEKI